jgi:hypothetical protein
VVPEYADVVLPAFEAHKNIPSCNASSPKRAPPPANETISKSLFCEVTMELLSLSPTTILN